MPGELALPGAYLDLLPLSYATLLGSVQPPLLLERSETLDLFLQLLVLLEQPLLSLLEGKMGGMLEEIRQAEPVGGRALAGQNAQFKSSHGHVLVQVVLPLEV